MMPVVRLATMVLYHGFTGLSISGKLNVDFIISDYPKKVKQKIYKKVLTNAGKGCMI